MTTRPLRHFQITACTAVALVLAACGEAPSAVPEGMTEIGDIGLAQPRAVVYDSVDDVYLVSNMNGDPLAQDENGFVTRLSPDGEVLAQQWSPKLGTADRMHAPKGMAILGDSLFIADIQCIRIVDRAAGDLLGSRCLDVSSLSGVDVGPEGSVFVTDSGFDLTDGQTVASGSDAVYRLSFQEGRGEGTLAEGADLDHPTGVAVGTRGIFVTTAGGDLLRFTGTGERTTVIPQRQGEVFEGVVFVSGGGFAFSSSSDGRIYLVDSSGGVTTIADGLASPGDLGYDSSRDRLLVPLTQANSLLVIDLSPEGEAQ
jgi:hypothetical protein